MNISNAPLSESKEKNRVTLYSALTAVVIMSFKVIIGVLTGSLGILAEALHSALDLVASLVTYFAVRLADRPPDEHHHFGHGKIENLAAGFQAGLLLLTAVWIMYESLRRIFFGQAPVDVNVWAFAVMFGSIIADYWRSRLLLKAARKYRSQAMEADALNFQADMWGSGVVIFGLTLVLVGRRFSAGWNWLEQADSFAAIAVSLLIIHMSLRLGYRSLHVLIDRAPAHLSDKMVEAARSVEGVIDCTFIRVREAGNKLFADLTITVSRNASLAEAHLIADKVEEAIHRVDPATSVVVHIEPAPDTNETLADAMRAVALEAGLRTHDEKVRLVGDKLQASLHLELNPDLPLTEAHDKAHELEHAIKEALPELNTVNVHLETISTNISRRENVTAYQQELAKKIVQIAEQATGTRCPLVEIHRKRPGLSDSEFDVVLTCRFGDHLTLKEAHRQTEKAEQAIRQHYPRARHVIVHAEPNNIRR